MSCEPLTPPLRPDAAQRRFPRTGIRGEQGVRNVHIFAKERLWGISKGEGLTAVPQLFGRGRALLMREGEPPVFGPVFQGCFETESPRSDVTAQILVRKPALKYWHAMIKTSSPGLLDRQCDQI